MKKLSAGVKLAYGAGDFGFSTSFTIISIYLMFFLADVVGFNPAWIGTALLLAKIWDAVIDPFIGRFSDNLKSRWGRRRPFFLFLAVPFGITFMLLWYIPVHMDTHLTLVFVTLMYVLHITFYSGMAVPYTSLTAELTEDYDERTSLTAYRMVFSILGGLVAAVLPPIIVEMSGGGLKGYTVMGAIFGTVVAVSPFFVFAGCRESRETAGERKFGFFEGLKMTFNNKPYLLVLAMFLLTWLAIDIVSVMLMFFLKYVLDMEAYSQHIIGVLFIVAALFLPLWVWASKRYGKKASFIAGMGFLALTLFVISLLGEGMMTAAFVLAFLAGIGLSAAHVLPFSIIPDCIEYDELKTGQKRSGAYYGMISFMRQLSASLGVFITGQVLNLSGYVAGQQQGPGAILAMKILLGVVPGFLMLTAILAISFYGIGREQHEKIKRIIDRRKRRTYYRSQNKT